MFKINRIAGGALLGATLGATLIFQNCAPGALSSKSSESVTISSVSDVTLPDDHPSIPDDSNTTSTSYDALLVDRYYIDALFTDVYGPNARAVDTFHAYLNTADMGSPCAVYETYFSSTKINYLLDSDGNKLLDSNGNQRETLSGTIDDKMQSSCGLASSDRLIALVNPKATVTREAKLARACSDLSNNMTTLTYALAQIDETGDIPAATDANVLKAYQMFYRLQPDPDQGLVDALKLLLPVAPATPSYDDWRGLLYTVCVSPQWQVM